VNELLAELLKITKTEDREKAEMQIALVRLSNIAIDSQPLMPSFLSILISASL
jgi:hypothetical protein